MKTLVIIPCLALMLLTSCATQKMGTATYNDDVYSNPAEDRIVEARIKEEKRLAQVAADQRYNDSIAAIKQAQKAKDDANPYYKDREFKYDDYYDYEYATRVKRFNNDINGLSYYDNYYTNSYFYSQNPYNYGVSIYNGYSWWGSNYNYYSYNPAVNFYNSWGWSFGNSFNCYNGYNPYMAGYAQGYNNGFNNGMFGNYYGYGNPYGYGGGFGNYFGYGNYGYNPYGFVFNNPYNNGWGYYNVFDNNSSYTYGPRSSNGGGNSRRTSNPGMSPVKRDLSASEIYIRDVAIQQDAAVKFNEIRPVRGTQNDEPIRDNNGTPIGTGGVKPIKDGSLSSQPVRNPVKFDNETTPVSEPIRNNPIRNNEPVRNVPQTPPVKQNPIRNNEPIKRPIETPKHEAPNRNNSIFQTPSSPSNNGGGSSPSNNGGGSSPSNNGGGRRPR